ncbi:hypothetical protein AGLY_002402 [Aphis glycines]|uniref:Uncharacterized protein n=1 Tax=Aphis glycines TaxID=307491 RepID=A0A6G0U5P3_APHGL|nr:hypothetical protein AGLY_002402 [Aphis glycines]
MNSKYLSKMPHKNIYYYNIIIKVYTLNSVRYLIYKCVGLCAGSSGLIISKISSFISSIETICCCSFGNLSATAYNKVLLSISPSYVNASWKTLSKNTEFAKDPNRKKIFLQPCTNKMNKTFFLISSIELICNYKHNININALIGLLKRFLQILCYYIMYTNIIQINIIKLINEVKHTCQIFQTFFNTIFIIEIHYSFIF